MTDRPVHEHLDPLETHGHNLQIRVNEEGVIQLAHPSFSAAPPKALRQAAGSQYKSRGIKHLGSPPPSRIWIVSFTDIMALMLTFFVTTYAMSEPRVNDYRNITQALEAQTSGQGNETGPPLQAGDYDTITLPRVTRSQALDLGYLEQVLADRMEHDPPLKTIRVETRARDLMIHLPGTRDAAMIPALASLLAALPNRTVLEGVGDSNFARVRDLARALQKAGLKRPLPVRLTAAEEKSPLGLRIRVLPWK